MQQSTLLASLPEFLSPTDLVHLGLYTSIEATRRARKAGSGPKFIQVGPRRIKYAKQDLQEFMRETGYKLLAA